MIKTEADRKDQWERLAWRMSVRTGEPYKEAMGTVLEKASTIYFYRLIHALINEAVFELEGEAVKDSRFQRLMNQYPYEKKRSNERE